MNNNLLIQAGHLELLARLAIDVVAMALLVFGLY
jgi:hypothetical protein